MDKLIEKLRKAREAIVTVNGKAFTVRRPTDLEIQEWAGVAIAQGEIMRRFVMDWDLTEADIINGGTPVPVPFTTGLFMEWVADQPTLWAPLIEAITTAYQSHQERLDAELKKPDAG